MVSFEALPKVHFNTVTHDLPDLNNSEKAKYLSQFSPWEVDFEYMVIRMAY